MIANSVRTLLRNARVVCPDRVVESASVLIEDDRIAQIVESSSESIDAGSVIDLDGLTLLPGFIDIHIHGAAGIDTMAATAEDLGRVGEFLARHGVTSWLPTLVPADLEPYERAVRAIGETISNQRELFASSSLNADRVSALPAVSARVLGVHYEGPFVNSEQCGALHREHFRVFDSTAALDGLPTITREEALHMMTLAPEIDGGMDLIRALTRRNWVVSIGHTKATASILDQALAAGARHMTHFMNAMTPLHHRDVGAVGWGLVHDDVTLDIIADGIHVNPAILKLVVGSKSANNVSLISDAIAAAGQGDGDYEIWGERITVSGGRTENARGSIAGSVITMLDAVRTMSSLGFSEIEVAQMASQNPARLLGIDSLCGSIEAGKRADVVAVDENLNVRLTIVGGRTLHHS